MTDIYLLCLTGPKYWKAVQTKTVIVVWLRLLQKLTFVGQDLVKLKICLSRRGSVVLARVNNWLSSLSRLLMNDFDRNYNHKFSSSPIHSSPWRREVSVAKKVFSIYLSISVVKQVLLIVFIEYRLYWLSATWANSLSSPAAWLTDRRDDAARS